MNPSPNLFALIIAYALIAIAAIIWMVKMIKESEGEEKSNDES